MRKKHTSKSPVWKQQDPQAERETQKYERPIPSRELIMETLKEQGLPLSREQIADVFGLHDEADLEALRRRLNAMERDGQVVRNRRNGYGLVEKLDLVRGRVIAHPDGFGFLVPEDGGDDLFLSPRQMRSLFHGDRAVARVTGLDQRGRREGAIVEVIERNTQRIVGRFYCENGVSFVVPDSKRITQDISIPPDCQGGARQGQIVTADIIEQPSYRSRPIGRVAEVLGDHMAPGMEIDIAIRSHALPLAWPPAVEAEIAGLTPEVSESAKQGREDLRGLALVTIDGADSRDFDDAVYCERKAKGWRLLVAIADVAHYVIPDTALDREASTRGNSVYFPERVIPMLPEILSNGLCSLNPQVDRLCMVCEMSISEDGRITRSRFIEGLMRSHARLTYEQVAAIVVDKDHDARKQFSAVAPHLDELYRLYQVLRKERSKRGAIDFETTETRIVFADDRKIERIVPVVRNDAHKIIEECMITANVATARFLEKNKMPTLYRVHEGPKVEKLIALREMLKEVGLSLRGGDKPEPMHYAQLLDAIQKRPDAHLLQTVMLRSLSQARYVPENAGHFGLALGQYVHFTSPIRRYPDLLVHRAIRHVLRNKAGKGLIKRALGRVFQSGSSGGFRYGVSDMQVLGEHCSMTERRADEATRDAIDWLKCEYMMDKVGEEFPGVISGVTSFGIFVELQEIYVEGLVHVTALKNDYYHFDPAGHRLRGERSGKVYRLADQVNVRVVRVDLDERKVDFELVDGAEPKSGRAIAGGKSKQVKSRSGSRRRKKTGEKDQ
ncbi:MAG: ribonuclease R [Gammaproteobacteria bacterium]